MAGRTSRAGPSSNSISGAGALSGTLDLWDAEWDPGERSYGHFTMANPALGSGRTSVSFPVTWRTARTAVAARLTGS